jgi:hypothetical protein
MFNREVFTLEPGSRASRYNVSIPVRYRPLGDIGWTQTQTINISLTGILFETNDPIDVNSPIELSFDAPVEIGGSGRGELTCMGQVVRTMMPPSTDAPLLAAASITDFHVTEH